MGRMAQCSSEICAGTLAPLLDKEKTKKAGKPVTSGFYCESCGTVYEDVETKNGIPLGVRPKGRMDERSTVAAIEAKFQDQILEMEGKLIDVAEALLGEDSDLAVKIGGILSGSKAAAEAEVPKPKLDSEVE